MAHGDVPVLVLTFEDLTTYREIVKFHSGDLIKLANDQLKPSYKNIWMVGGPIITKDSLVTNSRNSIQATHGRLSETT